MKSSLQMLKEQLRTIGELQGSLALVEWDQETQLPSGASEARAGMIGNLSKRLHKDVLTLNKGKQLQQLAVTYKQKKTDDAVIVRETLRSYERAACLPTEFVSNMAQTCARAQHTWAEARRTNNFALFAPYLEKIVRLKREEAKLVNPKENPYNVLLDTYEPGLRIETLDSLFQELEEALKELLQRIQQKKRAKDLTLIGTFPLPVQLELNRSLAEALGFDFSCGRLDASTHPFTTNFHPTDVRITTRYREEDPLYAIGSTIHEVGHALYEQGLPITHAYTPLAEAISLGIHESQSRLWENLVGRSLSFWEWFQPQLAKTFPKSFKRISAKTLWHHANRVTPSLIRTESDEVTYNLHIIIRYQLERALIEGSLRVKDLPIAWNQKMKDVVGIRVPNDRLGVLQDVHWSGGMIGYFPTYTLGNLYSAQFFAQASKDIPRLTQRFRQGKFAPLLNWLRLNIHSQGKRYSADELVRRVTGSPLSSAPFLTYLEQKMKQIYDI
jgi:carboxypeptidase Taq